MDPVYQNALSKRDTLRKQREQLDTDLKEVESFLSLYSQFAPKNLALAKRVTGTGNLVVGGLRKASIKEITDSVADILLDGQPRHTRHLIDELNRRGMDVTGQDLQNKVIGLSAILGRERDKVGTFKNERAVGWSLAHPKNKGPLNASTLKGPDLFTN